MLFDGAISAEDIILASAPLTRSPSSRSRPRSAAILYRRDAQYARREYVIEATHARLMTRGLTAAEFCARLLSTRRVVMRRDF